MIKSLEDFNIYTGAIKVEEEVYEVLKNRKFIVQLPLSTHPRLRFAKSSPLFKEERGQIERSEIRGELASSQSSRNP